METECTFFVQLRARQVMISLELILMQLHVYVLGRVDLANPFLPN